MTFPQRPDHPDYWMLSKVMIAHDAEMDKGGNFEDAIGRFIDLQSLAYVAVNQGRAMAASDPHSSAPWPLRRVQSVMASAFISAFIAGMRYAHERSLTQSAEALPWQVQEVSSAEGSDPLDTVVVARFSNQAHAELFASAANGGAGQSQLVVSGPDESAAPS